MSEFQEPADITPTDRDAVDQPWWARPNGAATEPTTSNVTASDVTASKVTEPTATDVTAEPTPDAGSAVNPHEPYLPGGSATYPATGSAGSATMVLDQPVVVARGRRRGLGVAAALIAVIVASSAVTGTVVHAVDGNGSAPTTTTIQTASGAAPTSAATTTVKSALATISPSVVIINTVIGGSASSFGGGFGQTSESGTAAGTGIIESADGVIVTNAHVIADATSIKVTLSDGRTATATVLGADTTKDLAAIKISGFTNLTPAVFAQSSGVSVGDQVLAVGNAEGYGGSPSVSEGIVSALGRSLPGNTSTLTGLIQTDAAINPGNSGGPLVDTAGHVIGIDTAIATGTSTEPAVNIGFAIPSSAITAELPTLIAGTTKQSAYLGVQLADTGPAVIGAVGDGSPASNAGLQAGDTITKIDGKAIASSGDAVSVIGADKPGQKITITVASAGGGTQQVQATLTTKPATD